jgi:hypothetical protein
MGRWNYAALMVAAVILILVIVLSWFLPAH